MTAVTPRVRLGRPARPGRIAAWFRAPLPQPPAFWRIAIVVGSLALLGLLMVLSASSVIAVTSSGSAWSVFLKQAVWLSIGSVAFFVGARVDYHRWQRWAMPLWGAALLLCLAVFIPSVGIEVDGGRRWIGYGDFRMQPSELAKLALLVAAAAVLTRRADAAVDARRWAEWVRPMAILFGPLAAAVFFEPDMDSVVVLAFLALVMIVVAGVPGRVLVTMTAVGLPVVAVLALVERYRISRILALVDPAGHEAVSYQTVQSVMAMGRGGFFGVGIGAGRAKWHYLPNAHTDFIFSIIGEELGLIGTLAVLGAFAFLAVVGFGVARRSPDRFGALLAAGITAWIAGQAVINLGAVAGVLPVAGITLPFLSAGGSSLVVTLFAAGILANVARLTPDAPPRPAPRRSRP